MEKSTDAKTNPSGDCLLVGLPFYMVVEENLTQLSPNAKYIMNVVHFFCYQWLRHPDDCHGFKKESGHLISIICFIGHELA